MKKVSVNMKETNSVEIELSDKGNNLYVFFGGIRAGIGTPVFEFYNSSKIMDENKLFFRDFSQCWYQNGLNGISNDINLTVDYINHQIDKIEPKKIFFVGNSMGGYAAILFASLVGKGDVIAFAPQTFISFIMRLKHRDFRWQRRILITYIKSIFKRKEWDLKTLLLNFHDKQKISIFVSTLNRLDYIHALHIKDINGVNVYGFEKGGHGVVKTLREEGILPAIMSGNYKTDKSC